MILNLPLNTQIIIGTFSEEIGLFDTVIKSEEIQPIESSIK